MKPIFEFGCFLALALGAHLLIWQANAMGTVESAGEAGDGALTLSGANAALQDTVAQWNSPPEVDMQAPAPPPRPAELSMPPEIAVLAQSPRTTLTSPLPMLQAESAFTPDSPPPQPPPSPKPKPRAKEQTPPKAPAKTTPMAAVKTSSATERPKGKGGAQATGQNGSGQQTATSANPGQMARWGGAIRTSIERRKQYPAGSHAKGSVSLAITVSSTGALTGLSIAKSSGDAVLDHAALAAVKRARLPKAPAGIAAGAHRFTLSVSFAR
jgi:protein TonB